MTEPWGWSDKEGTSDLLNQSCIFCLVKLDGGDLLGGATGQEPPNELLDLGDTILLDI